MKTTWANSLWTRVKLSILFLSAVWIVWPFHTASAAGTIWYVKPAGTGDCSSWASACELSTALASSSLASGDEIWVMKGTYTPNPGGGRNATFQMKTGVAVYGGFAGVEVSRSARNWTANVTTLSGDLNGDDASSIFTDNTYHVVTGANSATLDGFTITGGRADAGGSCFTPGPACGGGMLLNSTSPTLSNLTFSGNMAGDGGGLFIYYGSPTLTNVTMNANKATNSGGGIDSYHGAPVLNQDTFTGNSASIGGGISVTNGNMTFSDLLFTNNTATIEGGGMYNGGNTLTLTRVTFTGNSATTGGGLSDMQSNLTVTDATFTGNTSTNGGGAYDATYGSSIWTGVTFDGNSSDFGGGMQLHQTTSTITNSTFYNNSAGLGYSIFNWTSTVNLNNVTLTDNDSSAGAGIFSYEGSTQLRNSIAWGNSPLRNQNGATTTVYDSVVQYLCSYNCTFTNVLTTNPRLGTLSDNGGLTKTIPLLAGSSAIDAGSNATCAAADQRGTTRTQGPACDAGAYEYVDTTPPAVTAFTGSAYSNNLAIPITTFTATDDAHLTGYLITESSTPPVVGASGWSATAQTTYPVSADGVYTLYPWAKDATGFVSSVYTPLSITVDTVPPAAPVVSTPANGSATNDNTPTVSGTAEAGSTVKVYFDGALNGTATADASGNWSYTPTVTLSDGSHIIKAIASDAAGNTSVDSNTNTSTVDATAPETTITAKPALIVSSTSGSFSFTGSDSGSGVAGFHCEFDGAAYAACTSPVNFTGLSAGSHTFQVYAIDNVGNVDATPATYTWTVDTTSPGGTMTSTITSPTHTVTIPVTVQFSEAVTGFVVGDVTLTNATLSNFQKVDSDTYTFDLTPLADGTVTAVIPAGSFGDDDGSGNTLWYSTSDITFTIDYVAALPEVNLINSVADTGDGQIVEDEQIAANLTQLLVVFNNNMNGSEAADTANFSLMAATSTPIAIDLAAYSSTTKTTTLNINGGAALPEGRYTLTVSAIHDAAGGVMSADFVRVFNIDKTGINVMTNGVTLPDGTVVANGATFTAGPKALRVTFSEDAYNPAGDTDAEDVTNPANYLLVRPGTNGTFETAGCSSGLAGDDASVSTNPVTYDNNSGSGPFVADVRVNGGAALPNGQYRLFVCGTTSITDLAGNHLNGSTDYPLAFTVQPAPSPSNVKKNPATGFAPGIRTPAARAARRKSLR